MIGANGGKHSEIFCFAKVAKEWMLHKKTDWKPSQAATDFIYKPKNILTFNDSQISEMIWGPV